MDIIVKRSEAIERLEPLNEENDPKEDFASLSNDKLDEWYCLSGTFNQYHPSGFEQDLKIVDD